jgi:arginyl-tRNA synthetase
MALIFPKKLVNDLVVGAIEQFFKDKSFATDAVAVPFSIEFKDNPAFGDCSCNAAFSLSKIFKQPPEKIAGVLKALIESQVPTYLERIEIAGGGFLNFHFTKEYYSNALKSLSKISPKYFAEGKKQKIIIEYSSPNVAKPMHVGLLRNTLLGNALANLYDFLGYKVIRWNHLGDWGTQFGKLIAAYKKWGDKDKIEKNPIGEMLALYVKFHKESEREPEIKKEGQAEFKKLEDGDKENLKLLEWFLKESLKEFHRLYNLLGIEKFDKEIGESFYSPMLSKLIEEFKRNKMLEPSEGAMIIRLDAFGLPPALIQKSDGATLYLTREIASLQYRLSKFSPSKILYVVGNEQSLHFQQFFAIARLLGIESSLLEHVKYELVLGSDGKKFSTREGNIVAAQEVIDDVVKAAKKVVDQKRPDISRQEREEIASSVGVNALKYFMLKDGRLTGIIFDINAILAFNGNSGPYLNYAYARLSKILAKAGKIGEADVSLLEKRDLELVKKMLGFEDAIGRSKNDSSLHHLCDYLFELANKASGFYEASPILTDQNLGRRNARLLLITEVSKIMEMGFEILGIKTLERI